nr:hypothetical protein [Tanacetum cinerariifolium]
MLIKRISELEQIMTNLIQDNKHLEERLDSHEAYLYTLENLDIPQQVSKAVDKIVTDAVDWAIQASLRNRFRDFPKADMKEIFHQRIWETNSYKAHEDHMMLYEALEKYMNRDQTDEPLKDLVEARKKKKKRRDSLKTPPGSPPHQPPPPPLPGGASGTLGSLGASGSSQVPPPPPPPPSTNQEAWTTTDTRLRSSVLLTHEDLHMDDDMAPDAQVHSSDDGDIRNAHIPKVNLQQDWWKPLEKDRPATPELARSIPSSDLPVPKSNWAFSLASTYSPPPEDSLLAQTGPAFELVKVFHPNVIHFQYQMEECHKLLADSVDDSIIRHNVSKPLPLGGPPGQVTIQYEFFFNKDLEYLRYDSKGGRPTLSILKIKAAYYPDVGLKQMVPDQMWIEEEHISEGDCRAVRTHMRILSVVRIEVFSMYGYDYIKKIVLRKEDLNEHIISERDFKYLYPSDFEDLYLLNLQGHLNHLPPKDKKILTTAMIMQFNEIHNFSDGNLHQIDEPLNYQVKEFKANRMNLSLNTRFWTRKDVDRSKEFKFAIQKRLKTRRIFCNLESFVGGRVKWIKNGARTGIYGFVAIKSAYYSKSSQSRERIINPQETQVVARDEKWVSFTKRVKISSTNVRLETTVSHKEETFQVVIDLIKNSSCFKGENFDYPELIWEDIAFQIDHTMEKRSRHRVLPDVYQVFHWSDSPKKSRGKVKRKTASRRVVKKKVTIYDDDNIVPDLDVALELGKSISLTKANEEEEAKQVHDTHARIVTKSVPESAKKKSSGRSSRDIMQALKESKKTSKRQPGTGGSSEGTGTIPRVLDESTVVSANSSEETDAKPGVPDEEKDIDEENYKIRVRKDKDVEMLNDEVEYSGKGDVEVSDAAKTYAEKIKEAKDDSKKAELLPKTLAYLYL